MLSANSPPLLSLPLELREQIYSQALSHPSNGPQLLGTCHEIYTEARKFLFQRPLVFHGQSAFYRWLAITPSNYLHHVSEIVLELHDVDLEPLLGNAADAMQKSSVPRLLAWELYGQELERLQAALQKVHKVKLFTLRALEDQQSFLYRNFLGKVLEMLGPLYPDLQHLGLAGNFHYQSLTFLSALSQLRSFSFDGFTSSSPPETAEILSSLQHLSSLSLVSQYTLLTPTTTPHVHSAYTSKPQSFTGAVLRTMNHLASFSVTEPLRPACSPTLFLVPELLAPLHTHAALRRLAIALAYTPDKETLAALEDFMRKAPIERLELDWPQLLPEVLEEYVLVGGKVRDLWIRARDVEAAFEILWSLVEGRGDGEVGVLERVVLVRRGGVAGMVVQWVWSARTSPPRTTPTRRTSRAQRDACMRWGVRVEWCTEGA